MKRATLFLLAILLTACAAPTITRSGSVADPHQYSSDRIDCLNRNGYVSPAAAMASLGPVGLVIIGAAAVGIAGGIGGLNAVDNALWAFPTDSTDKKASQALDSHLKVNRPAYACMEQRGYALPF